MESKSCSESLKIMMVRPRPLPETIGLQHLMVVEPLELEVMAALVPPGDVVRIIDLIMEKRKILYFLKRHKPDVLCVTGYITHLPVMTDYCRQAKRYDPSIVTIVGGIHIELFPSDIEDDAIDFKIVRNATRTFPELLEIIRKGKNDHLPAGVIGKNYSHFVPLPDFDFFYPIPRRDLTLNYRRKYFYVFHDKVALMKTSFGCPYTCNFCYCRLITGNNYHVRPLEEVMEELKGIKEEEIYIVDDDFLVSPARVASFISNLRQRQIKKRFLVYGRADFIIHNPDLIREFKDAGLRTIIIGLESFDDTELEGYNKKLHASANEKALKILNDCGIDCYAAIILPPDYSQGDFDLLRRKIRELGIKFLNLQPLTPLPGVQVGGKLGEVIMHRKDYGRWDLAHVIIRPEKMSLADYYRNILKIYRSVAFRPRNIISHMKYPLRLHWRLIKGLYRLNQQYRKIYKEALGHV